MSEYRLQTVLEMRDRAEQAAKEAYARAMQALAAAQAELREMEQELARRKAERQEKVAAYLQDCLKRGAGASAMQSMGRYEQRLRDEEAALAGRIAQQQEVVAERGREVEARRHDLAEASKEKKVIEKHKEKWAREVKAERDRREELAGEEIGNALFLARRGKEEKHG